MGPVTALIGTFVLAIAMICILDAAYAKISIPHAAMDTPIYADPVRIDRTETRGLKETQKFIKVMGRNELWDDGDLLIIDTSFPNVALYEHYVLATQGNTGVKYVIMKCMDNMPGRKPKFSGDYDSSYRIVGEVVGVHTLGRNIYYDDIASGEL